MSQKDYERLRDQFFCGDAVELSRKHIKAEQIDLIITDPPYGIQGQTLDKHYHRNEENIVGDYVEWNPDEYLQKTQDWVNEADRVLRPGGSIFVVSGYTHLKEVLNSLSSTSLKECNHIIWKYQFGPSTTRKFVSSHCHVLYWRKPGGEHVWNQYSRYGQLDVNENGRKLQYEDLEDVWRIPRENKPGKQKNKNELPMQLLGKMLQYASNPGDLVLDFFLGGFTTAKVAKSLGRFGCGFELSRATFKHGYESWKSFEEDLDLPKGKFDRPKNQGKAIEAEERDQIVEAFKVGAKAGKTKKEIMERLMKVHERGCWAIEKILKSAGGWRSIKSEDCENAY